MIQRILAFFLVISALAGCAAKSIQKDYSFSNETADQGIVVVSVSHDLEGTRRTSAIFYMDGGVTNGGQMLRSLDEAMPGMNRASEFKDSYGHLLVLALPSGRHTIDSWQITNGSGLRVFPRNKPTPLAFDVAPGQVTYLGNLHANLMTGKNVFGITITGDGYPEVRNQQQRDIALFENKYPQFKDKVVVKLLPLGPWAESLDTWKQTDPIITTPILKK